MRSDWPEVEKRVQIWMLSLEEWVVVLVAYLYLLDVAVVVAAFASATAVPVFVLAAVMGVLSAVAAVHSAVFSKCRPIPLQQGYQRDYLPAMVVHLSRPDSTNIPIQAVSTASPSRHWANHRYSPLNVRQILPLLPNQDEGGHVADEEESSYRPTRYTHHRQENHEV